VNWYKQYAEFASDPKVQAMSEPMQRRLVMLFCLHCSGDLAKLTDEELALAMRISPKDLEKTREMFRRKGFIADTWVPKNWHKRQDPSDPTAAERMRRFRKLQLEREAEQHRNVTRNVTEAVTSPNRNVTDALRVDTDTEADTEAEGRIPPPPSTSLGPEYTQVGEFAIQLGSDVSWGSWVDQQGMCGHSAATIKRALEEASGAGKLSRPYVAAKLRGWAAEGGPPKLANGKHGPKPIIGPTDPSTIIPIKRPNLPRTPECEDINRYWDNLEAQQAKGAAL
jgi:hypothetical protein